MTYGDGVGSINITELIKFHLKHGQLATMTAVQPPGRFGALDLKGTQIESFLENLKVTVVGLMEDFLS